MHGSLRGVRCSGRALALSHSRGRVEPSAGASSRLPEDEQGAGLVSEEVGGRGRARSRAGVSEEAWPRVWRFDRGLLPSTSSSSIS
jgi:hypothetical protein